MTMVIYRRSVCLGFTAPEGESMTIMAGSMAADRQAGTALEQQLRAYI